MILYGIASRHKSTAESQAKSYGIQKAYGSYDELLNDPAIDFVYISLPNSMHYEWASKALSAGKHVLVEKPFTSNAIEAEALVKQASESGKILMEAFHWQFHPAAHAWRALLESGEHGKIITTDAVMCASPGVPHGDIRWQFELAGGALMDMTYAVNFTRYAIRAKTPTEIFSAVAKPYSKDPRVDAAMTTSMLFETSDGRFVYSKLYADMARSWIAGIIPRLWEWPMIEVDTEKSVILFYNAMMPHLYHYIAITDKKTGQVTYKKQYSGGPVWDKVETSAGKGGRTGWSTYRWQLEAFVDAVKGTQPPVWVTNEESVDQMQTIDMIYQKAGLP